MVDYGLAGTNPFTDWPKPPEQLLSDFLKAYWDETDIGVPLSSVLWDQEFIEYGDLTINFRKVSTKADIMDLGDSYEEDTAHVIIDVFSRSFNDQPGFSAEDQLQKVENWVRKTIQQYWKVELVSKGVLWCAVDQVIPLPSGTGADVALADWKRINIIVVLKAMHTNIAPDSFVPPAAAGGIIQLFYDMHVVDSAPSNPSSTDLGRFYLMRIDADNVGGFVIIQKNGAFVPLRIF